MPTPAEDFAAHNPWAPAEHVAFLAERKAEPYCYECHDWHRPDEDHSATLHTAVDDDGNTFEYWS